MPELYLFTTPSDTWRFTDSKKMITYLGNDYVPSPVKRDNWDRALNQEEMKISGPSDVEPFSLFIPYNPSHPLFLKVISHPSGDVEFYGKVIRATYTSKNKLVDLILNDFANVIRGDCPSGRFSVGCNWRLFDSDCTLSQGPFSISFSTATAVFDDEIGSIQHATIATKPDGYFTEGRAENGSERLHIVHHEGDTVWTIGKFVRRSNVSTVLIAGCSKTPEDCENKFNNLENFGGFPLVPEKNPTVDGY